MKKDKSLRKQIISTIICLVAAVFSLSAFTLSWILDVDAIVTKKINIDYGTDYDGKSTGHTLVISPNDIVLKIGDKDSRGRFTEAPVEYIIDSMIPASPVTFYIRISNIGVATKYLNLNFENIIPEIVVVGEGSDKYALNILDEIYINATPTVYFGKNKDDFNTTYRAILDSSIFEDYGDNTNCLKLLQNIEVSPDSDSYIEFAVSFLLNGTAGNEFQGIGFDIERVRVS